MSFNKLLAQLPALTSAERRLLIRRALELDGSGLSPEEETLASRRAREHQQNPKSPVPVGAPVHASVRGSANDMASFTPRAQQVINVATEKARAENRSEASPSDIAFGLIALGAGVAFNILQKSKINVEILAQTVATNPDAESYKVLIPEASKEARRLSHSYIGTEHLLLALLNYPTNALTLTLSSRGTNPNTLRREILQELDPNFDPTA